MNPITALLIGAGYGYLSGNPSARKQVINGLTVLGNKCIDALNASGGDAVEPKADSETE